MKFRSTFAADLSILDYAGRSVLIAILYFWAGKLGLAIPYGDSHVSLIWLPTGIAVAALFRWGPRYWAAVYAAALAVNLTSGSSILLSCGIAVGNTAAPMLTALLLNKIRFNPNFSYSRDVVALVAAAVIGMLVSASGGALILYLSGNLADGILSTTWLSWWMGDVVGVFLATPFLLALSRQSMAELMERRLEVIAFGIVMSAVSWFIFLSPMSYFSLAFVPATLIIWAAMRFGITGASLAVLTSAAIAIWGTATGRGPFHLAENNLLVLWAYMTTLVIVALVITALQSSSKRNSDQLRLSEERLQLALMGANDATWDVDLLRRQLYYSPRWWHMIGYKVDEFAVNVDSWRQLAHPDDIERIAHIYAEAFAHGPDITELESRIRHKEGHYIWVLSRGIILRDASGKAIRACGTITDLTDRKLIEEKLRESEETFRLAALGSAAGIWDWTAENDVLHFSPRCIEILEVDDDTFVHTLQAFTMQIHPDDREQAKSILLAHLKHGATLDIECRALRRSGASRWIKINGQAQWNAAGRAYRVAGSVVDIDERKLAEEALSKHIDVLRRTGEIAKIGGWELDLITGKGTVTEQVYRIYEKDPAVPLDLSSAASFTTAEAWPRLQAVLQNTIQTGASWEDEFPYVTPSGRHIWVRGQGSVALQNGKPIKLLGALQDITDRKRLEAQSETERSTLERLAQGEPLSILLNYLAVSYELMFPDMFCSILLLDETGKYLSHCAAPSLPPAFSQAIDGEAIGPQAGSCGTAAYTGQFVMADDIATDPLWANYKDLALAHGLQACWSMPIFSTHKKVLGTFALYYRKPRVLHPMEREAVGRGAHLSSLAIERHQAEDALHLAAMVYQHSGEAMVVSDARDRIIAINPAFTKMTGYTIDAVLGKRTTQFSARRQNRDIHRAIRQALELENTWQGELWNKRKNGDDFAEWITINIIRNEDGSVHRHVYLFSDITEKKRADELILQQANFDPLTGLPNRSLFRDRLDSQLKKAARADLTVALLFIDLDLFKEVNDTLGHDVGDTLLIEAAQRIKKSVRESDTVARLGGDEFTVILSEPGDWNDDMPRTMQASSSNIAQIAQKILQKLAEPFHLNAEVIYLSASIGITLYPNDSTEPESLLKNADQAMYVAKSEGRNRFSFFTRSMQEQAHTRLRLSNDLRSALASNQLEVYFQPIIDLCSGGIVKAEALLRWHHPQRGMVSPAVFIPIAEDSGLINEIGEWVFEQSAAQAMRWSEHLGRPFQISVNKSPVQFISQDNHSAWPQYLQQLGLPGHCIAVEITEGLLLNASPIVYRKLQQFRDAGIQISIDDFGTGYSSMSYLKKFELDYIKIDQSFIHDMTVSPSDRAIVEAIIVMAHKLGYKVIAEGIETAEQRAILLGAGCDFGQGYLFARPIPAPEFEQLLRTRQTF